MVLERMRLLRAAPTPRGPAAAAAVAGAAFLLLATTLARPAEAARVRASQEVNLDGFPSRASGGEYPSWPETEVSLSRVSRHAWPEAEAAVPGVGAIIAPATTEENASGVGGRVGGGAPTAETQERLEKESEGQVPGEGSAQVQAAAAQARKKKRIASPTVVATTAATTNEAAGGSSALSFQALGISPMLVASAAAAQHHEVGQRRERPPLCSAQEFSDRRIGCLTNCRCGLVERCYPLLPNAAMVHEGNGSTVFLPAEGDPGFCDSGIGGLVMLSLVEFLCCLCLVLQVRACILARGDEVGSGHSGMTKDHMTVPIDTASGSSIGEPSGFDGHGATL